ncbi:MAG: hypothetical protein HGB29_03410 [Chlorobiaceae bacterium]|nr:hypothetical protein [Chlorobiaceae bacterium]NTW73890.1 hypothetical protein [Chlorobiaceae bacterium]
MEQGQSNAGSRRSAFIWTASLILTAVAVFFATTFFSGSWPYSSRGNSGRKQALVSEMRINLARASEREKSAVLSLTDEDARNFADQSREASDAVERDRRALGRLLEREGSENERTILKKFDTSWDTLRKTDATLLELAAQNTNRKAIELSETICSELLQKYHSDLSKLTEKIVPVTRKNAMERIAGAAETAALNIALLQLRHINAPGAAEKAAIVSLMKNESQKAVAALRSLESMTGRKSLPFIKGASTDFNQFMQVNEEIVRLSNINSNRTSAEQSVSSRRLVDTVCDRLLRELGNTGPKGSK